jgi:MFS family permease
MSEAPDVAAGIRRSRPSYGWVVVGIAFLSTALVLGSRFSMGMFLPFMPEALGVSAADVSGAFAISMIGAAVCQPYAGLLFDRLGGRAVLTLGLGCAGVALCGSAYASELWQVIVLMGLGSSIAYAAVSPVLTTAIVIDWFDTGRGAPLGVATSGTKVAMVVLPPILAAVIAGFDWRVAMFGLGAAILFVIPIALLFARPPANKTRSGRKRQQSSATFEGPSLQQALRMPAFWLLAVSLFANGQVMNLVFIHLPNYMLSQGYTPGLAALALALLGGVGVFGTVATGVLSDKIGSRSMLLIMFAARGLSALLVIAMPGPVTMVIFVLVFGLLGYGAIGVIGSLAPEIFGKRSIGTILGTIYVFNQVGGAAGVYSGGLAFDLTGDYGMSLWLSVATTAIATVAIAFLPTTTMKVEIQRNQRQRSR